MTPADRDIPRPASGCREEAATSRLDPALVHAYLQTQYRTCTHPPIYLALQRRSDALLKLHDLHGACGSVFITAWNPASQQLDPRENRRRQDELRAVVDARGWTAVDGVGEHPDNDWLEESLLVFGPSLQQARALGLQFGQNAIIWSDEDGVPGLVLLR